MPCTNRCGWEGPQTALQEHLKAVCPKRLVACKYKDDLGCCRELVPLDQLEKHMHENMQKHLDLAMNCLSKGSMLSKLQVKQVEDTVKQQLEKCLSQELVSSLKKSMKAVEEQIASKLKVMDGKLKELEEQSKKKSELEVDQVPVCPCTFLINVNNLYNENWESKPFYSHPGGVKMNLTLWKTNYDDEHTSFTVKCGNNWTYCYNGEFAVTVEAMSIGSSYLPVPMQDFKKTVKLFRGCDKKGKLKNLADSRCSAIRITVDNIDKLSITCRS